ncbi:serine hydrolase [soil metagenome]
MTWNQLEAAVADAEQYGTVGVAVIGPNGSAWSHNGQRKFKAASTVKIPLMIELFRRIDAGDMSLSDRHTLKADEKAPGSGVMLHLHDGVELTLNDLIYLMISISDNTATNLLIQKAGMDAVNATMQDLGMTNSNLGREMKNRAAQGDEMENWAAPDDYVAVVKSILDGEAASAESCMAMRGMLQLQQNKRRISRYLPEDDGIEWGSKTGSIKDVANDVGYVRTAKGTLIIAVFCENMPSQPRGERMISDITRAALLDTGVVDPLPVS